MDTEYLLEDMYEPKGRYYQFETTKKGSTVLKPVKVPAHVKAEREARIRKREMKRRVAYNRERATAMNIGYVAFMALALSVCCIVCYVFISLQGEVSGRLSTIGVLQNQLEEMTTDNAMAQKHLMLQENLKDIQQQAENRLGMQQVSPDQIQYYSVADTDYMVQYEDVND